MNPPTYELCQEVSKGQEVRLLDILVLGPFLLYLAFKREPLSDWERAWLIWAGAATVLWNAHYFQRTEAQQGWQQP